MRTLTVKKGGGSDYAVGWHTLTISDAKYGDWEGKKFLDVWFSGYPENFTMRVYEKKNKDGEEFAIGQVFRFANAGITDGLDGPDGNIVVKIDDDANNLKGHQLNVYFYKEGEFSRALKQVAPTAFENIIETFNENDVTYWKNKAERYFLDYVQDSANGATTSANGTTTSTETADIPF